MTNNTDKISTVTAIKEDHTIKIPKNFGEINSIDDIVDDLRYLTIGFPEAAIEHALNTQVEMTPILLNFLDEVIHHYESIETYYFGHLHALYLLAQFREKQAFHRVIKIMSLPNEWPEDLLGDTITEDLHNIVASLYNGDLASIHAIIENTDIDTWSRNAALKTLLVLVKERILERSEVILYFKTLFDHPSFRDDYMATTHLINVSCDLYPDELQDQIQIAFDRGMVDEYSVDMKWVKSVLSKTKDAALTESLTNKHYGLIDDKTIRRMKHWACFSEKIEKKVENDFRYPQLDRTPHNQSQISQYLRNSPKIGRNDPCSCNSGKKYKKCCLPVTS
jgi:hypothetical protein